MYARRSWFLIKEGLILKVVSEKMKVCLSLIKSDLELLKMGDQNLEKLPDCGKCARDIEKVRRNLDR